MERILGWSLALWLCGGAAWADWMYLGTTGSKPNRTALFVDLLSIDTAIDKLEMAQKILQAKSDDDFKALQTAEERYRKVEALEIYEAQNGPESRVSEFAFDMFQGNYYPARTTVWQRDGRYENLPNLDWMPVRAGASQRCYELLKNEEGWREALRRMLERARQEPLKEQSELSQFGYEYVQASAGDPTQVLFRYLWTDASPPQNAASELTAAKSREYLARMETKIQAANRLAGAIEKDLRAKRKERQALRAAGSALHARLTSWIGVSERELVNSQGEPNGFYERNGYRYLTYSQQRVEDILHVVNNGPTQMQQKVGENVFWWSVTYEVQNGRVVDYEVDGNDIP